MSGNSDALRSLYIAVANQLRGGSTIWESRVFPDVAPGRVLRPVVIFNIVAGGDSNRLSYRAPGFLLEVKCVASGENAPYDVLDGAAAISDLLNDQGYHDFPVARGTRGVMIGDDKWLIKSITQQGRVHIVDDWNKIGEVVYYSGHEFVIEMEEIL